MLNFKANFKVAAAVILVVLRQSLFCTRCGLLFTATENNSMMVTPIFPQLKQRECGALTVLDCGEPYSPPQQSGTRDSSVPVLFSFIHCFISIVPVGICVCFVGQ